MVTLREQATDLVDLVPAVDKAFRILEVLKEDGGEHTIAEISRVLDVHKSTVHKILATLSYHGVVQRDELTKRYSLGLALADYGTIALEHLDIRRTARPFLKELGEYTGETVALGVLQGTKVIMVDKREPSVQIRVSPRLGWRFPATLNSLGKAILAWLPENRLDEILWREGLPARTAKSITDPAVYRAELALTRERGYATEVEEFHDGVNGVAAPVLDSQQRIVAALAAGGPAFRMTADKMAKYGEKCIELAREILAKL